MRYSRAREIGSCFSRLVNVIAYRGTADLSLSARAGLEDMQPTRRRIDAVFTWLGDPDHCAKWAAVEVERAREIVAQADASHEEWDDAARPDQNPFAALQV